MEDLSQKLGGILQEEGCGSTGISTGLAEIAEDLGVSARTLARRLEREGHSFREVLDRLRDAGFGSQPPVAYRALDFLVANGFAHKIERLNAFIACAHPGAAHAPAFLICRACDAVNARTKCAKVRGRRGW